MIWAGSVFVSIIIVLSGVHFLTHENVRTLRLSTVASSDQINLSNPYFLKEYMNPDGNPAQIPIGYFPFVMPGNPAIKVVMIPQGTHIAIGINTTRAPIAFGAYIGIALINTSHPLLSQLGFSIDSVKLVGNSTTYLGKSVSINAINTGSDAFVGVWSFGPAYIITTAFYNDTGQYVTSLNTGIYSLSIEITLYNVNWMYASMIGKMNMTIPWAQFVSNYSGASYPTTVLP